MLKYALPATGRHAAAMLAAAILFSSTSSAQAPTRDSTRADSSRTQKLERVMISAVRGGGVAPISQKTLTAADIEPRYFGQDVPLALQGITPSLTSYAETGNYWGYSYIRLRGIDQSRINLTLDGIPLNDPEDQVLYFADFPDLANSLNTVQVQRGVGTSSSGTAAYAGSINMETIPLTAPRQGNIQLEGGSFGSKRISAEYQTGLLPSRFAAYMRVSGLKSDGYRYHSGVEGKSLFFSGGYFGDRDILKLTATTGTMKDTMAYYGVALADLDTNRRINPLDREDRDGFGERLLALSYTRLITPSQSFTITPYRISASGDYDVLDGPIYNYNLKFVWYGATADWSFKRDGLSLDVGGNANTYARDHAAYERPNTTDALYFNTGHKQDVSAFTKLAYTTGAVTWFGDLQARNAKFRYTPDKNAGISEREISWTFLNPKVGLSYAATPTWSLTASYGKNTREPARNDMFGGLDNLDSASAPFVGDLSRVKPETAHDVEAGASYHGHDLAFSANIYSMDFRNEIAPIGAISDLGAALRKNVDASYRRGIEADASYRGIRRVVLTANASVSKNRIREYVDSTGDTPITYHNVSPLLTPTFQSFARGSFAATRNVDLAIESRYQNRTYLTNTSDANLNLPAYTDVGASIGWHIQRYELMARVNNLTDGKKYGSGYASDGVSYYFVLPPRNFFLTMKLDF
ncbi:MAG TPA: TonB-dependent receptor [Gemmatimonadaceae bacterium]|jgi:iron complex outermembrane receptor protein